MKCFRRWFLCLCVLLMISGCACAEVDAAFLEATEGAQVFLDDNGIDTVIRPSGQPFFGTMDHENMQLCSYLDYVEMPGMEDTVFIRLTLAVETWEQTSADRIGIRVGKENYIFEVNARISEYDMTYYEDYVICLTDKSLPMLKAMAGGKTDTFELTLYGEKQITGRLELSRKTAKTVYNRYVDAKGHKQNLESFREIWPCIVEKSR